MLKKDSSTDGQCNSRRFNMQDSPKFFSEYRNSRNQYDHTHKLDDEVKMSTQYLPRTCCSTNTKNHFQDLNEKFQELESKMFEVEKCFKDANKREIDEVRRLMDKNDMKSPTESIQNMQKSRLYEISECMKECMSPCPSNGMHEWFGDQNHSTGTEKKKFQHRVVRNGSGDALQLQGEEWSEDSCKTLMRSNEKPPFRHGVKGIFTLNHFDGGHHHQSPNNRIPEDSNDSPDVDFLEKSKKLILTLIDKELKKIESKPKHFLQTNETTLNADNSPDAQRMLKVECIKIFERELMTLKKLEALEP